MRNQEQILSELTEINGEILSGIPDSDISLMLTKLSTVVTYLASSASLVAESGFLYNQAKKKAYHTLKTSSEANQEYYSPMLAKDYINSCCAAESYLYEFAQRLNSAVTHTLDALRTAISAEKQNLLYQSSQIG